MFKSLKVRRISFKDQSGSVMVETTFSLFVFAIIFLFMIYFYEVLETTVKVQIDSGVQMREEFIASNNDCYHPVEVSMNDTVSLSFNIRNFVPSSAREVEILSEKIAFSGSCPGRGESRFDNSRYRQYQDPNGRRFGDW